MRIFVFTCMLAATAVLAVCCSKEPEQFSNVPDLGVVYFSQATKIQHLSLGNGTNYTLEFATNAQAFHQSDFHGFDATNYQGPLLFIKFQATNTDGTVRKDTIGWLPVTIGQKEMWGSPEFSVKFIAIYQGT